MHVALRIGNASPLFASAGSYSPSTVFAICYSHSWLVISTGIWRQSATSAIVASAFEHGICSGQIDKAGTTRISTVSEACWNRGRRHIQGRDWRGRASQRNLLEEWKSHLRESGCAGHLRMGVSALHA